MSRIRINIDKVNQKFENFARFLISHRALLLVSFIALLAISIVGMKKIYVEASWDSYFIEGDPMLVETDKFKETFGNDYFVGVMVESDHSIISPDNLKLLRELSNELRDSLSYSDGKATSIVDLEYMLGTDEGMEIVQMKWALLKLKSDSPQSQNSQRNSFPRTASRPSLMSSSVRSRKIQCGKLKARRRALKPKLLT